MEVIEYSVTKGSEVIKIPSIKIHLCPVKRNKNERYISNKQKCDEYHKQVKIQRKSGIKTTNSKQVMNGKSISHAGNYQSIV